MDATTLEMIVVLFVAGFIRSAFGFGEALVAVPLLALLIGAARRWCSLRPRRGLQLGKHALLMA
jgi:uncharacterized membrane protein YfcA